MHPKVRQALIAASVLSGTTIVFDDSPLPPQRQREKTPEDIAKLEAAAEKRKRKALKRQGRK